MSRETMAQGVWMDGFFQSRTLRRLLTGVARCLGVDGVSSGMPTVAGEEPVAGFSPQPSPMAAQFLEQLGAEHHIAVFAPFAAPDVNHHALAVDVADLQARQLRAAQ